MTTATRFDPTAPLGDGRTVIEASAGTGKTFAIAGAVARLVAVEGIEIEDILVVTFTVAATAELKRRVRARLVETMSALDGGHVDPDDPQMANMVDIDAGERQVRAARVGAALTRFDRAQIFTIHGFAQRMLGQLGFLSRLPVELDPGTVDDVLVAQVVGDLAVGRLAGLPGGEPAPSNGQLAQIARTVLDTPDAAVVPEPEAVTGLARTRVELAHAIAGETRRRMRRLRAMTFDDGLFEARDALTDPTVAEAASGLLRRRYRIALVDESQDTDPVQWDVIRRVFDGLRLVVIGDPKQSIYGFRAADVESYLAARHDADAVHTLTTNWRSDGPLLKALDTLLTAATFGDGIDYIAVEPAPGHEGARIHGAGAPLSIRRFAGDLDIARRKDNYFAVGALRSAVAADVASEVVKLLDGSVTLDTPGSTGPVGPGDIAILCRTVVQVDLVREALRARRVPSVAARTGGVFASPIAEDWRRFLLAVERPDDIRLIRLAATTRLVGRTLLEVATLGDDEVLDLQHQVRRWQGQLASGGVPEVITQLERDTGLAARILAQPDGERLMTDLTHIAEELHAVWRRGRAGSLAGWLEAVMGETRQRERKRAEEPEERQRRLETDAAAVQVLTVHGAKGLEFPVVFVPFAWDVWIPTPEVPVFHDPAGVPDNTPRRRLVDVAGADHAEFAGHVRLAMEEDRQEESRLLYVALTRARHRLVVWWIENHANVESTKIHQIITVGGRTPADLVSSGGGFIDMPTVAELPTVTEFRPAARPGAPLARARFGRSLDTAWQRASFSSLSPEHPLLPPVETTDEAERLDEIPTEDHEAAPVPGAGLFMADLPRGARFGTLVHQVFEDTRFDAPDLETAVGDALARHLEGASWDFDVAALVAGMVAAATTPLGPEPDDIRLCDLGPRSVLDELRFELPVRPGGKALTLGDIAAVMLDHLPDRDPYRIYATDLLTAQPLRFRGFLTGAIDVTAAVPGKDGPRYVVMDYKSNALRAASKLASPLDYGPASLNAAMVDGHYVLQATLYLVALHRYLQWRLPGYDPVRHLGGSRYLFVRGMVGQQTPVVDGERCGVARWSPPVEMIPALSRLFAGDTR
jgi:exodeoxyribonuclease V beta subunit